MKWLGLVIVAVIAFLVITSKAMPGQTKDNNSAERMRKLRAIKKKKAEERNRSQMKAVA